VTHLCVLGLLNDESKQGHHLDNIFSCRGDGVEGIGLALERVANVIGLDLIGELQEQCQGSRSVEVIRERLVDLLLGLVQTFSQGRGLVSHSLSPVQGGGRLEVERMGELQHVLDLDPPVHCLSEGGLSEVQRGMVFVLQEEDSEISGGGGRVSMQRMQRSFRGEIVSRRRSRRGDLLWRRGPSALQIALHGDEILKRFRHLEAIDEEVAGVDPIAHPMTRTIVSLTREELRKRERDRERDRQRERQTDRQRERQTERERDREREREKQRERETERERQRETERSGRVTSVRSHSCGEGTEGRSRRCECRLLGRSKHDSLPSIQCAILGDRVPMGCPSTVELAWQSDRRSSIEQSPARLSSLL
jgi:hypothetical protein